MRKTDGAGARGLAGARPDTAALGIAARSFRVGDSLSRLTGRYRTVAATSAAFLIWGATTLPAFSQARQVVLLYDERPGLPGLATLDAAFTRAVTPKPPEQLEIYREAMDLSRFDSAPYRTELRDHLHAKYAGKKIDVVVAVMQPALDFLINYRDELFPGAPIVFCGLDRRQLSERPLPTDVTGVILKREFAPTIELVARLHPETERFVVVAGTSQFDMRLLAQAQDEFKPFEKRFTFTYLTNLPRAELLSRLSQLPPRTIILYTTMFRDGAGQPCVPHDIAERISAVANVPLYGFLDQYVGHGIVGGRLYSMAVHGEAAAGLVQKILAGEKAENLPPIEPTNNSTQFDERQLERWKIDQRLLPADATILFREPTIWEENRRWIIVGASIVLLQGVLITALLLNLFRRRRAEMSLEESEDRFQTMADASPVLMWVSGEDKRCTYVNKAWLNFTGRRIEQELGHGWAESIHPDDREKTVETYVSAFDARKPFVMHYRLKRHDGEYRSITDQGVPRHGPRGNFRGYVGACLDITDLLRQERALNEFEERVTLAAEAAQLGVWELNTTTGKVWVSDKCRELFQLRPRLIPCDEFHDRVHPEDRALVESAVKEALAAHGGYEIEYRTLRPDGTMLWIAGRARCVADEEGELTRLLGVAMDVTVRKQVEEEARRQRMQINVLTRVSLLGEMTASLAHELNQPLSAIISNANAGMRFMDTGKGDAKTIHEILEDVAADARRANEIILNVRNTIKKGEPVRRPISMNEIVENVAHMIRPDATSHCCEIETSLADNLPTIEGDPIQIQEVLINLIGNAFDAMRETQPSERRVEIATEENGHHSVHVSVRDHGVGISDEVREQLFEQFYTTKEEGLGMGLAIVRSIVETHGGIITVENAEGGGARFDFTLPLSKDGVK